MTKRGFLPTIIIAISLMVMTVYPKSIDTFIPKKAYKLLPIIYGVVDETIYPFGYYAYFPGLLEQESCVSLTHSRCMSAESRLYARRKNGSREEGIGVMQLTRVWRPNGKVRFDSLTAIVRKYPRELRGLNWKTVRKRIDLQIKAGILLWRDNYIRIKRNYGEGMSEMNLIAFADSAYNGGYGGLRRDIRKCKMTKGCNPKIWFDNVEITCTKSKRALYGRRNACMINREHVLNSFKRSLKYFNYSFR